MVLPAVVAGGTVLAARLGPAVMAVLPKFENTISTTFFAAAGFFGYSNWRAEQRHEALMIRLSNDATASEIRHRETLAAMTQQDSRSDRRFNDVDARLMVLSGNLLLANAAIGGVQRGVYDISGQIDKLTEGVGVLDRKIGFCSQSFVPPAALNSRVATRAVIPASAPVTSASAPTAASAPAPAPVLEPAF